MNPKLQELLNVIIKGEIPKAAGLVQACLDDQESAEDILNKSLIPAMAEVGRLFEIGEYYVPEMLIAAKTMQSGLDLLRPLLVEAEIETQGTIVIGTVQGDLHDIGKNLVGMMLEGAGFKMIDLGVDVSPDQFIAAVETNQADILAMSALLTTTMPRMEETVQALQTAGLDKSVKVMIGGAPISEDYADQISAAGFAPDAGQAAKVALSLLE